MARMQETVQAHRVETTLKQDGTLVLEDLPFQAGESVEVIILLHPSSPPTPVDGTNRYSLRGLDIQYEHPTDPVAQDDWGATQ
jgi:hypothetical protein